MYLQLLSVAVPIALAMAGWARSVDRRLTRLETLAQEAVGSHKQMRQELHDIGNRIPR